MRKIHLSICLDQDIHAALKEQQARTGCGIAEYIRRAVRLALFADQQKKIETRG